MQMAKPFFVKNMNFSDRPTKVKRSSETLPWDTKNIRGSEPILNFNSSNKHKKLRPISSSSRKLMVEPPLFLKKQNS